MTCVLPYVAPLPVTFQDGIRTMSAPALDNVSRMTDKMLEFKQEPYRLGHTLHGGIYTRVARVGEGFWTGALVTKATTLTIIGDALVYVGTDEPMQVHGVTVIPAAAGRKQAFVAQTPLTLIMSAAVPDDVDTVAKAEAYLCAETHLLPPAPSECGEYGINQASE